MVNRHRGEIEAELNGKRYTLCLTLGALAELEDAYRAENLMELASRFENGRLTSRDLAVLISCGLRGAGQDIDVERVMAMKSDKGLTGFVEIAKELLSATFGSPDEVAAS